jgi:signal transduction histidine kinase
LSNAIKYTLKGYVKITFKNAFEENGINIIVQDTGVGINPD